MANEIATKQGQRASGVARATFGTVLFIAWGVLSVLWVYDAIYKLAHGEPEPAIAAVVALLLMLVLAVMEGLEVVMIHGWKQLYPERTAHDLGDWLAARSAVRSHRIHSGYLFVSPTSTSVIDIDGVGSTFDTNPGMIELVGKPTRPAGAWQLC